MKQQIQRRIDATFGYLALAMFEEAREELDCLPQEARAAEEVQALRVEIFQRLGQWAEAREIAESLATKFPGDPRWWISWAYALRRERSVEAAREVLVQAAERHPDVALIAYNLACYASVMGVAAEALELLKRACAMDPGMAKMALHDPDFEPLWKEVGRPQDLP